MYGATIGSCAILNFEACTNQACAAFLPNKDVNHEYLYYFFRSIKRQLVALGQGGGQPNISATLLKSISIPLPPLDDQIRIAHLLGKVEGLIAQRKENLRQLDDLLKSVFLEMFGDIKAKKSVHEWEKPRPYLTANSGKSSNGVKSSEETEFPIYGGNGVNGWASKPLYNKPVVIAGRVGQQCGIIHVSRGPCWVTDNAIALTITDHDKLNTTYLATAFQNAPIREKVKQLDLPFINQSMLLDFPIPMPPIGLQNQFAAIVEKVEAIKSQYQQSLTELENLYGVLSQKTFKGELDLARVPLEPVMISGSDSFEIESPTVEAPLASSDNSVMSTPENRGIFLRQCFANWLTVSNAGNYLSFSDFLQEVQLDSIRLCGEDDFIAELTLSEYDLFKEWLFEAIENGEIKQTRNIVSPPNEKIQFGNQVLLEKT